MFDSIDLAIYGRSIGDGGDHIIAVGMVGYRYVSVEVGNFWQNSIDRLSICGIDCFAWCCVVINMYRVMAPEFGNNRSAI